VRGGHRRANGAQQIGSNRGQIDLISQLIGEDIDRARCAVAVPVEAPVDSIRDTAADRLE
jgi:hypothetical protein